MQWVKERERVIGINLMNIIICPPQLCNLKDRMKEVLNAVQIIEKKMDAVKVTKSKVSLSARAEVSMKCSIIIILLMKL